MNLNFILIDKFNLKKKISQIFNIIDISVIIPIFNNENYISECLNSVIKQSLKNIEIICIDDGSTDKSLKILKKFKNIDKRIKIILQNNKGPGIARNIGINASKGKYIAFLDSDDFYPNNLILELMLKKAIQNKVIICGGGLINFVQKKNKIKLLTNNKISFPNDYIINYFNYQYDWFFQRFIYKKIFLQKKNIYFSNYLRYQDPPFFIKAMAFAKKFYALKNITYYYRISNKTKITEENKIIDLYKGIKECLDISESMKLYKLYCRVLSHINDILIINEAKKYIKNEKLKNIITKLINNINYNIIKKENCTFIKNGIYE